MEREDEMNDEAREATPLQRVTRGVATVFFLFLALAIGYTLVPTESVLRSAGKPLFWSFRMATGLDQHWNMFGTISYHRDYEVTVEIEDPVGRAWVGREEIGPILPGLDPVPDHFRYHTLFTRFDEKRYSAGVDPFVRDLGQAILEAHPDWEGRQFRIRKVAGRLNSLDTVRDLEDPSYPQSTIHGPYRLIPPDSSEP